MKAAGKVVSRVFVVILCFSFSLATSAQDGTIDLNFDGDGVVTTSLGSTHSMGFGLALQLDNKIIVAGNSNQNGVFAVTLARYLENGTLDATFGNNGIAVTLSGMSSTVQSIVLQGNNKIIAVGGTLVNDSTRRFTAIRYTSEGALDTTFGIGGIVLVDVQNSLHAINVAIQSTGKIIISGYSHSNSSTGIALVRLNTDGTPDTDFGDDGVSIHNFTESPDVEAWGMTLDANDKIVTTGLLFDINLSRNKIATVRFNSDGTLDTSFGADGISITSIAVDSDDFGNAVAVQADGKIVIAGSSTNGAVTIRYNSNGTPDISFGTDGIVFTNFESGESSEAYAITAQDDGKIIVAGVSGENAINGDGDFGLVRYGIEGELDFTFGTNGKVTTDFSSGNNDVVLNIKQRNDGKIVVCGISHNGDYYDFAVARYNNSIPVGIDAFKPYSTQLSIYPNPMVFSAIVKTDEFLHNATLSLYNSFGQIVRVIIGLSGHEVTLNRKNLPNGIYFIHLIQDDELIGTSKLNISE